MRTTGFLKPWAYKWMLYVAQEKHCFFCVERLRRRTSQINYAVRSTVHACLTTRTKLWALKYISTLNFHDRNVSGHFKFFFTILYS